MKEINLGDGAVYNVKKYADAAGEPVWCECSGDFSLPDYMPQIAKMLKVDARVVASGKYIGSDKAEFSGSVVFGVMYTGEDGLPFFTNLTSDYEYSVPLGDAALCDDINIYDECAIESTSVRPCGPRKISVKSKIKALPHVMYKKPVDELLLVDEEKMEYQKLCEKKLVMTHEHFESGEFELEDVIKLDASPDAEPVGCDGNVCVTDVRQTLNGVLCRGEVECRVFYYDIEAGRRSLFCACRKLRFEKEILSDHTADVSELRAWGRLVSAELSRDEGGEDISLLAIVKLCGDYMREEEQTFLKDVYSCVCTCDVEYRNEEYRRAVMCKNVNFSYHAQKTIDQENAGEICCSFGSAAVDSVSVREGKAHVTGDISIDCVVASSDSDAGGYSIMTVPVSFKCEVPVLCMTEKYDIRCIPEVNGIRARMEKNAVVVDTELFLSLYIAGIDSISTVKNVETLEDVKKCVGDTVLIYYPEKDETLWSVGKKYSAEIESLARANGIDASRTDAKDSLEGVYSILIK